MAGRLGTSRKEIAEALRLMGVRMNSSLTQPMIDSHGRVMRDLRISVTDRCNLRCLYCLPETEAAHNFYRGRWAQMPDSTPIRHQWQPRSKILTYEEIERIVRIAAGMGIQKIRLTGGEPLLRRDVENLVARLAGIDGIQDLAMTSNGVTFRERARALRDAGLKRISFSLDSLDQDNFQKITGRDSLREVMGGIALAQRIGFHPVKVNAVVIRDLNDHEIVPLAEFARDQGVIMRFIEFMPLDSGRAWLKDLVVTGKEIMQRIADRLPLEPIESPNAAETAKRWRFADGSGEIGIIAPVSQPFCGHCNRIRLTADGKVRTCLFSVKEHDLRTILRHGATDEQIGAWLREVVLGKEPGHRIGQSDFVQPERTMSCIGG